MRVTVEAALTQEDAEKYPDLTRDEKLQLVLDAYNELEEDEESSLLSGFCIGERETYNNDCYDMGTDFDHRSETSGDIYVSFTGSAYFGCRDMDRLYEHEEVVTFKVDLEDLKIEFATELPGRTDRPPDEEF